MQGSVTLEIKNNIGTIEFFHPQSNSLPSEILNKLASTISQAGTNDEIKVVIIKSKGDRAFCAGASFDELSSIDNFRVGKKFFMGFANVINACRKCPKLIICRVQGKAVGGGVGMACAGDYCFATKYASVKLSELAVGIGPFVVGPAVEKNLVFQHIRHYQLMQPSGLLPLGLEKKAYTQKYMTPMKKWIKKSINLPII